MDNSKYNPDIKDDFTDLDFKKEFEALGAKLLVKAVGNRQSESNFNIYIEKDGRSVMRFETGKLFFQPSDSDYSFGYTKQNLIDMFDTNAKEIPFCVREKLFLMLYECSHQIPKYNPLTSEFDRRRINIEEINKKNDAFINEFEQHRKEGKLEQVLESMATFAAMIREEFPENFQLSNIITGEELNDEFNTRRFSPTTEYYQLMLGVNSRILIKPHPTNDEFLGGILTEQNGYQNLKTLHAIQNIESQKLAEILKQIKRIEPLNLDNSEELEPSRPRIRQSMQA